MCVQISLQALDGQGNFNTMRLMGQYGKKPLHILLDSESTHNFIDTNTTLKLSCKVEKVSPMWVRVADGGQLKCDAVIRGPGLSEKCKVTHLLQICYYYP